MAEDLVESLKTYRVQLEQVEAALASDPGNEDLLKLQADLKEVIQLTAGLTEADAAAPVLSNEDIPHSWAIGDLCVMQWTSDSQWYKARIDAVTSDGMAAVTFVDYPSQTDAVSLATVKTLDEGAALLRGTANKKRQLGEQQRQQQKKKKQKKFDRQKQIDELHEQDKHKWQSFASKSKKMRGVTKKSIFATPEAANGRVGIGTCGLGGAPMTDYSVSEKRRRGV